MTIPQRILLHVAIGAGLVIAVATAVSNVQQIPGTGLGLLIVQRCVGLHGGAIQFESLEARGTTFTVALPLFAKTAVLA